MPRYESLLKGRANNRPKVVARFGAAWPETTAKKVITQAVRRLRNQKTNNHAHDA